MQPLNVSFGIYAFLPMGWISMAFIILGEAFPDESLHGQEKVRQEDLSILNGFQYRQWCPRDYNDHGTDYNLA